MVGYCGCCRAHFPHVVKHFFRISFSFLFFRFFFFFLFFLMIMMGSLSGPRGDVGIGWLGR